MPLLPAFRGRRRTSPASGVSVPTTWTAPHRLQDPTSKTGAEQSGHSSCRASWTCGPLRRQACESALGCPQEEVVPRRQRRRAVLRTQSTAKFDHRRQIQRHLRVPAPKIVDATVVEGLRTSGQRRCGASPATAREAAHLLRSSGGVRWLPSCVTCCCHHSGVSGLGLRQSDVVARRERTPERARPASTRVAITRSWRSGATSTHSNGWPNRFDGEPGDCCRVSVAADRRRCRDALDRPVASDPVADPP